VCDVACSVSQQIEPPHRILVGHARAAVGEHDVLAAGGVDARADAVPLAPVLFVANDVELHVGRNLDFPRGFGGVVAAAVIDDDDLSGELVMLQEGGRPLDILGDFSAFIERRNNNRKIYQGILSFCGALCR